MDDKILETYNHLLKFSNSILELGEPITDNRIEILENVLGYSLPKDFKYFIKKSNSFSLAGNEVYGLGEELLGKSLDKIYEFEHNETGNLMPKQYFPFSPDGFGNHYCLDLSRSEDEISPIIFWQHDAFYESLNQVETCNRNFVDWVNEVMIGWTLEDYNYDGSDK